MFRSAARVLLVPPNRSSAPEESSGEFSESRKNEDKTQPLAGHRRAADSLDKTRRYLKLNRGAHARSKPNRPKRRRVSQKKALKPRRLQGNDSQGGSLPPISFRKGGGEDLPSANGRLELGPQANRDPAFIEVLIGLLIFPLHIVGFLFLGEVGTLQVGGQTRTELV